MIEIAYYLVIKDIAKRCGVENQRYRTGDDRYIVDNKDLARVRFSPDEYVNGLQGIEKITEEEARDIIRRNRSVLGAIETPSSQPTNETVQEEVLENESQEQPTDETPSEEVSETNEEPTEESETSEEPTSEEEVVEDEEAPKTTRKK